jgi:hypothetical protein
MINDVIIVRLGLILYVQTWTIDIRKVCSFVTWVCQGSVCAKEVCVKEVCVKEVCVKDVCAFVTWVCQRSVCVKELCVKEVCAFFTCVCVCQEGFFSHPGYCVVVHFPTSILPFTSRCTESVFICHLCVCQGRLLVTPWLLHNCTPSDLSLTFHVQTLNIHLLLCMCFCVCVCVCAGFFSRPGTHPAG